MMHDSRPTRRRTATAAHVAGAAIIAGAVAASPVGAQTPMGTLPPDLRGLKITEHLDEQIPLDLPFTDETGASITLGDYFNQDRPVILTLNYYRCPQACTASLNFMVATLKHLDWDPGRDFELVTVSFDPRETHQLADAKKSRYVGAYGNEGAKDGWHFLVGEQPAITALTEAVGFEYRFIDRPEGEEGMGEFAHATPIFLLTPEGTLSRYLYDPYYEIRDMKFALMDASDGKISRNAIEPFIHWCYIYKPESGSYVLSAVRIMQLGGVLIVLFVGGLLITMWRLEARRRAKEQHAAITPPAMDGLQS